MARETFYDLYCLEVEKNEKLKAELKKINGLNLSLMHRIDYLEKEQDDIINRAIEKAKKALQDEMVDLKKQVEQLKSTLNNDSTNSGVSTAKTPLNKNKHIPNSREKSGKKKGGQPGHSKNKLSGFEENEITDKVIHKVETCPQCGGKMEENGKFVFKDEIEIQVRTKRIRHYFFETICNECGFTTREEIPNNLKEENQYGPGVHALAASLVNEGYVSMSRTKEIIAGLTHGEINPSVGFIAKNQKKLHDCLQGFNQELKRAIIGLDIIHWDDTVIAIDKSRSCLRFYGDSKLAYYRAHLKKNKEGIDEDQILSSLDSNTKVVHDHLLLNYNDEYEFTNVECCVHLLRDLKKVVDNLQHEWAKSMIEMLVEANQKRIHDQYVDADYIGLKYDSIVLQGRIENSEEPDRYYSDTELTLLKRLENYKINYLMWTYNVEIPFSNNVAERSLRTSKTKMKVSGQFSNIENAEYFASIKSYLETGHRHGLNTITLIERAINGNYVTLEEMKKHEDELD